MNPRDSDFDSMESRPGGGGAGVVVWLLVLLCITVAVVLGWFLAKEMR